MSKWSEKFKKQKPVGTLDEKRVRVIYLSLPTKERRLAFEEEIRRFLRDRGAEDQIDRIFGELRNRE